MGDSYSACQVVSLKFVRNYDCMGMAVGYKCSDSSDSKRNIFCEYGDSEREAMSKVEVQIDSFCAMFSSSCNETGYTLCEIDRPIKTKIVSPIKRFASSLWNFLGCSF